jgi:hypothetical protein
MNIIEHNNNIANDDDINNERKHYVMNNIYMLWSVVCCIEFTICKKKSKI